MSALAAPARVGWCPGALRPMASGDGLIVRVKPFGGRLTPEQATGIADAAARFGNGALDLTSRANLQIRGVVEATLPDLTSALERLGLLDGSPEAEARRNVVASPFAGLDPSAAFDIGPAVAALEHRLVADVALAGLPAKFGFALSDGGAWPVDDVPADVRFDACLDDDGRPAFAIRLDGDDELAAVCAVSAMPEAAVRLAQAFVEARHRDPDLHRMRDLIARDGAGAVFDRAGLVTRAQRRKDRDHRAAIIGLVADTAFASIIASGAKQSSPSDPQPGWLRRFAPRNDRDSGGRAIDPLSGATRHPCTHPGLPGWNPILPGGEKGSLVLGVGAPFGRLDAAQLGVLANGARAAGVQDLRLTPWRAILVPGLDAAAGAALAKSCAAAGLVLDPADPRRRVAACPGAPRCHRGTTTTLDHATRWAHLVGAGQGIALHVSGCAKGCAHPGAASLTLVGREGRYDMVVDGRPGDPPTARGLDADDVERQIRLLQRRDEHP